MWKTKRSGDLGQGWPTPNSWEKDERKDDGNLNYNIVIC